VVDFTGIEFFGAKEKPGKHGAEKVLFF